jgi:hypothetical protein
MGFCFGHKMIGITNKMKVFGLKVVVKRPVSEKGYVIGLESFSPNFLTIDQTGFPTLT